MLLQAFSDDGKTCYQVFRFEGGRLFDRESFVFDSGESESETEEFLLRYYTLRDSVPKSIAIDREFDGMEEIAEWLSQKHGSKVGITVPQRGDRAQLVAMCKSNAAETLAQKKRAQPFVSTMCLKNCVICSDLKTARIYRILRYFKPCRHGKCCGYDCL